MSYLCIFVITYCEILSYQGFSSILLIAENLSSVMCLVAQFCPTVCESMDYSPPGFSVHGNSPGKNTGVGCHGLYQGIFPTQGLNPCLLHCRQILYLLSHQGNHQRLWETTIRLMITQESIGKILKHCGLVCYVLLKKQNKSLSITARLACYFLSNKTMLKKHKTCPKMTKKKKKMVM